MGAQNSAVLKTAAALIAGLSVTLNGHAIAAPMGGGPTLNSAGPDADDPSQDLLRNNPYQIVPSLRVNQNSTKSITEAIGDSYGFCNALVSEEYLVDCLGDQLRVIASAMPKTGEYAQAQKILAETSAKLSKLANQNVAPAKPRVRAKGSIKGRSVTTKPLTPVRTPRVKTVNQQAAAILQEAETKLLRSAEASDRRLIAYAQMAKAVGSNKTLLRSA